MQVGLVCAHVGAGHWGHDACEQQPPLEWPGSVQGMGSLPRSGCPNLASRQSPRRRHLGQTWERKIAHFWAIRLHAGCRTGLCLESPLL